MNKIEAIFRRERLDSVKDGLSAAGIMGLTVTPVSGRGAQGGVQVTTARGLSTHHIDMLPRTKLEVVVDDADTDRTIDVIRANAITDHPGDGKIFIYPVSDAIRISTGERGPGVLGARTSPEPESPQPESPQPESGPADGAVISEPCYWLFKSEPSSYSYDDLLSEEARTAEWDGVRNYQARNFMRDDMRVGDYVLFYHSNAKPPGVVGTARIVRTAYPDDSAWNPDSRYYDAKSDSANPTWMMVDIQAERRLPRYVSLNELKANPALADMLVTKRGQRLSIQPVTPAEWAEVLAMAERSA